MSFWTRNVRQADADLADDLSHAPAGGGVKRWLLGLGLALLPFGYGLQCLQSGHARFFGTRGTHLELQGASATSLAVAYLALGVFLHSHYFWGLHPRLHPWSPLLKLLSLLVFLPCLSYTVYAIISQ